MLSDKLIKDKSRVRLCSAHYSVFVTYLSKHQENMSVKCIPPYTPLVYSRIGVCRGIPIFLIFVLKHRLWVLVRTACILHGEVFVMRFSVVAVGRSTSQTKEDWCYVYQYEQTNDLGSDRV